MREYIFRGKRVDGGGWMQGGICLREEKVFITGAWHGFEIYGKEVIPESVGELTGLVDKNGREIFEGDIVQYQTYDDFDCQSVVKFGIYTQDGSGGEYAGRRCLGFYVYVDNFTCPDWCDNDPSCFSEHLYQQNINEVAAYCEIIGNIFENADLLEG